MMNIIIKVENATHPCMINCSSRLDWSWKRRSRSIAQNWRHRRCGCSILRIWIWLKSHLMDGRSYRDRCDIDFSMFHFSDYFFFDNRLNTWCGCYRLLKNSFKFKVNFFWINLTSSSLMIVSFNGKFGLVDWFFCFGDINSSAFKWVFCSHWLAVNYTNIDGKNEKKWQSASNFTLV